MPAFDTIDDIFAESMRLLNSDDGKVQIAQVNELLKKLDRRSSEVGNSLKLLRGRTGASFYVSGSKASEGPNLVLSVRVAGVECGTVRIRSRHSRIFTAKKSDRFDLAGDLSADGTEWDSPAVLAFLRRATESLGGGHGTRPGALLTRESQIETALLRQMAERATTKTAPLREHRPVVYPPSRGLPFQFPLPLNARNTPDLPTGKAKGHADVIARYGRGGRFLRVFEVKQEKAKDVSHALDQAIVYCCALEALMKQKSVPARSSLYRLLGLRTVPARPPSLQAIAVVEDTIENRMALEHAARRLAGNSIPRFRMFGLFYSRKRAQVKFTQVVPLLAGFP